MVGLVCLTPKSAFIKLADDSTVNIIVASVMYCLSAWIAVVRNAFAFSVLFLFAVVFRCATRRLSIWRWPMKWPAVCWFGRRIVHLLLVQTSCVSCWITDLSNVSLLVNVVYHRHHSLDRQSADSWRDSVLQIHQYRRLAKAQAFHMSDEERRRRRLQKMVCASLHCAFSPTDCC